MALAVLSVPHVLGPLQSLWAWATQPRPALPSPRPMAHASVQPAARPARFLPPRARRIAPPLPLRVVRVVEPSQARGGAGRMVISGRMADVCAELDRLAAREAQHR